MQLKYMFENATMIDMLVPGPNIFLLLKLVFYNNCRNSRALVGLFLSSICGQTHEFEIHVTRQRARAGNSTICYRKKQIDVSF